ncbi:VWA domain-containing protein [Clostridium fermenticellae]|uniref:VWA domain-containing protein n=1 Tax=Clostridium fermenticellae TaxID=2068654 RepID=A0A386H3Q4_9CLOT|nr:VIT and VWA domain-containing protein [Clostridium fermenticellae]AYD40163.1 VWA domain-containing protein [Clostridium fermenticellae]
MAFGMSKSKNSHNLILKRVSINGNVCGQFAEISINQTYENYGKKDTKGVYVFPIPKTAIISGFEVEISGRTLKAVVEEKDKACKIYESALERREKTLILEEFKPHFFKVNIGNIIAGESVVIKLSYIDELEYKDSTFKLSIPLIFESQRLEHGFKLEMLKGSTINKIIGRKKKTDFEFKANIIVESMCMLEFRSPSHNIKIERDGENISKVNLGGIYQSMDKDFILYMKEKSPKEADGMICEYKKDGVDKGIIYLRIIPKLDSFESYKPENYVFLIDISDTMKGNKLEQAKNALQLCIRNLTSRDKFDIIAMGNELSHFSQNGMVEFNANTLREASYWIDALQDEEDADIFGGIKYSIENEGGRNTILIFTDDQVEEENDILNYVMENIGDNRIFTFGIDSVANNYFLNKLAHESFGKAEFINNKRRIENVVLKQFKRIKNPEVDDMTIDWGDLKVKSTYPRTIDYMYDREPFCIFANVDGEVSGKISIRGNVEGKSYLKEIDLDNFNMEESANLLKKVWARKRIKSIEFNMEAERGHIKDAMRRKIIELSKENNIVSHETTFIFMELREEPVLGIELKNIIPTRIDESNLANEIEEIYESEDIKPMHRFKKDARKHTSDDNLYLKNLYPIKRLLRIIARNQFADGSFVDYEDNDLENKMETTAIVLLAFSMTDENIDIYSNQLNKSIEFISDNYDKLDDQISSRLIKVLILSLKKSLEEENIKNRNISNIEKLLLELYKLKDERKDHSYELKDFDKLSFKRNIVSLFRTDNNMINESINISNEKNSIFDLAKLAILMILEN